MHPITIGIVFDLGKSFGFGNIQGLAPCGDGIFAGGKGNTAPVLATPFSIFVAPTVLDVEVHRS